jgi:hypothetical protein
VTPAFLLRGRPRLIAPLDGGWQVAREFCEPCSFGISTSHKTMGNAHELGQRWVRRLEAGDKSLR